MTSAYDKLYNSVKGITFADTFETEKLFNETFAELINNPDFTYFGNFDTFEDINGELEYQGLTPPQIFFMNMARYGNVIEVLKSPTELNYHVFVGAR